MRAIVFDGRLSFRGDYPRPERKPGEALLRVVSAGVCATDLEIIKGYMGFKGVIGHEFCAVVEECDSPEFLGKRVAGEINLWCGTCDYCREGLKTHCPNRSVLGIYGKDGVFADYLTLPERNLHIIPDSITDEEAVFIEPVAAAFEVIEQIGLGEGKKVCVLGDGRLGLLTAQVMTVTGCGLLLAGRYREKLAIAAGFGIETRLGTEGLGREFDAVIDCTGSSKGLETALAILKPRGTLVLKTTVAGDRPVDLNKAVIDEVSIVGSRCGPFAPAIKALAEKKVRTAPLVSASYPLEMGVEAIEYASKKGVLKVLMKT